MHTGFVARWAGVTPPGGVAEELISIADITPTLVEAAGGSLNSGDCDGQSFLKMLQGEAQTLHPYVIGAFSNCNIIGNRERIFPIRVIRNKSFSLIYNPNFGNITSNTTLDEALAMLDDRSKSGKQVASSWVARSRIDPAAESLVNKLHHRAEYELYHLEKDPYEFKNESDNPEYQSVFEEMKTQLHGELSKLGDSDPIATEKSLVKAHASGGKKKGKTKK